MKKLLLLPFLLLAVLSMVACGGSDNEPFTPGQPETPEQPGGGDDTDDSDTLAPEGSGRYLVLYSSRTSNTERMARQIRTALDCDMIEVEPQMPYENDYNAMLERAQEELAAIEQGRYPAVGTSVDSFDGYDIVFVGYPIWYGSMATPMQAFLHEHASKLAGRRIALFATSGGSGISASIGEARSLCPEATFVDRTLLLTSSTLSQMEGRVAEWLDEIGAGREEPVKHLGRRPHDYRHDGGQCRRTGFPFAPAVGSDAERLQPDDRKDFLSFPGTDDRRHRARLRPHTRRHHDLRAVG